VRLPPQPPRRRRARGGEALRYVSTLGTSPAVDLRTAMFRGMAPDGSLYVPERLPRMPDGFTGSLEKHSLHDIARDVLAPFVDGVERDELAAIVGRALDFPIPLVPLEGRFHLLELFHGPTLAFKDVGARFMAQVMASFLAR